MKNNKIFSTLLLATTLTAMVAGVLSINSNVYRKVDAAGSYAVVYLKFNAYVLDKLNGDAQVYWDAAGAVPSVNELGGRDGVYDLGSPMSLIDSENHLYAYVLNNSYCSTYFNFTTKVGNTIYSSVRTSSVDGFKFSSIIDSNNILQMNNCNSSTRGGVGTWDAYSVNNDPEKYIATFLGVLHNTCNNLGNTEYDKLKASWKEVKRLYNTLDDDQKAVVQSYEHKDGGAEGEFADLYELIVKKYGNYSGFDTAGGDFLGKEIVPDPAPASKYVTSSVFENETSKNIIVVSSISLVSLSIIGIYFYIRKRKEDK